MEIYSQINTLRTWRWAEKGIARAAEVRDDYKAQGHRDTGTQGRRDAGTQGQSFHDGVTDSIPRYR